MYLKMDKIEPDECDLYLFWSSPSNTVGYSGDLMTYNIDVNGTIYTSRDNRIKIPHEYSCDQLYFNATIQATNECNMTSLKASFENILGNESDSIPSGSLTSSYPDASTSQNTLSVTQPSNGDIIALSILSCIIAIGAVAMAINFGVICYKKVCTQGYDINILIMIDYHTIVRRNAS